MELTEDILKQLMDLVFTLVCNGELSLARVLRKNILDKVEQKKLLRYTNSLKPLAARGVSARYSCDMRVTHTRRLLIVEVEKFTLLKSLGIIWTDVHPAQSSSELMGICVC